MAVTIKELSARCGLSVSTVSKALNDYPDVSEETRKQVRAVADEMGYRANAIARSLKIGRTFNLGVLYSDDTESGFTHSYFSPVLQSFKQEAERRGYDITFITHNMGHSKMTYLEHCRYRNVDGVCIVCSHFDDSEVLQLVSSPLPLGHHRPRLQQQSLYTVRKQAGHRGAHPLHSLDGPQKSRVHLRRAGYRQRHPPDQFSANDERRGSFRAG